MEDYSFLDESDCHFIFTNRSNNHNQYQISVSKTSLTSVGKGKKRFESFLEPTEESSQHQVPQDPHPRLQYTNRGPSLSSRTSETSSLADSVSFEVSDSNYNSMVMSGLNDALNLQGLKEVDRPKSTLYHCFKLVLRVLCLAIFIFGFSFLLMNNFLIKLWLSILQKIGVKKSKSFFQRVYEKGVSYLQSMF